MRGWWVATAYESGGAALVLSWAVWVIGSIVLHELGHGWAAIWRGDRTPIETGHMTWNPFVHMGATSLFFFALIGIAWGMMPVNPSRFRGRFDDAIVSFAGPLVNILLAVLAVLGLCAWIAASHGHWSPALVVSEPMRGNVEQFFWIGAVLNIVLAMFNLLPIPPLDGSRILATFVPGSERLWQGPQAQFLALAVFAGVFFFGARYLFGFARQVVSEAVRLLLPVLAPGALVP